jgi:hypothetical protein
MRSTYFVPDGPKCIAMVVKFAVFGVIALALGSVIVMLLWNGILPSLFNLRTITFFQAAGLLLLSRILFGGFRGHGPARRFGWRRGMMRRWAQMTPEEREKVRQAMRGGCGPMGTPPAEPHA